MDTYKYEKLRNVAVLGHGGAGKTTLVEAIAFTTGLTTRQGKVEEGNTISDYDREEAKRLCSVSTSVVPVIWEDIKINFLDTPGYFDFVGEVEEAVSACDAAVIVVSARKGIEVGTEKAWELCERYKIPRIFFVTDMDVDNASFRQVVEDLTERYGKRIAPFHSPIRENEKFVGFVNVVKMAGRRFTKNSEYNECPIPDYSKEYVDKYRELLMEAVAETSEALMEKYFNGEEFTVTEISAALRSSVIDCTVVPVLCGSGLHAQGTTMLLQAVEKYFPSPNKCVLVGINVKTDNTFAADYDANKPMTAKVFKTIADPFLGRFSLVKVCSGILKAGDTVYNPNRECEEKIAKLYVLRGKTQYEVKELYAGDIGAVAKLTETLTGDSLTEKDTPVIYDPPKTSVPYEYRAYRAKNKGDEDKLSQAVARMMEEDLTIKAVNDPENRQTLLYGLGEQHLEVTASKIAARYKVEMELVKPRVAYRETIRKKVTAEHKYKKQSGGHGQYGHVIIDFEPSGNLEEAFEFHENVFGGAVPKNFFPAVEKGIADSVKEGPLAGYPVVGIKATLTGGSYHDVDSSEMAFKTATCQAFKDGILSATPILLEPIATLKIVVPEKYTGEIMGDLNRRRGRVYGMNALHNNKQEIVAEIPMAELCGYSADLRSMTMGIGDYSYEFTRYEAAPSDVQAKVVEENA
ncbi:MAG: elongation factor G [Lachnospiraceae bacterium]|nr:elongation factor G [Lachnospiraceae bacterium]